MKTIPATLTPILKAMCAPALMLAALIGCVPQGLVEGAPPSVTETTTTHRALLDLPPPEDKVVVAVYGYTDQTGQYRFSDSVQTLSRAVTQGATSVLIKALQDAGRGSWFTVVERERLDNLVRERQIVREMRALYEGGGDLNQLYLPPMLFAGIIIEGGIIAYDTNIVTGGLGARFLGIGGATEYREDTVTVYLRAVSTNTGEILKSIQVAKTIYSIGVAANVFRFVAFEELLEVDAGFTANEPVTVALKQAVERAVIGMIVEGAAAGFWHFADPAAQAALVADHLDEKWPNREELEMVLEAEFDTRTEAAGFVTR
ncbi:MAG: CsgG/HfaB family protein [Inquilinaceae bacterium]